MPTYDYRCEKCGKPFSVVLTLAEHGVKKVACPRCGSRQVTRKISAFFAKTSKKS
jgi:putative FmdB family regulatory protein